MNSILWITGIIDAYLYYGDGIGVGCFCSRQHACRPCSSWHPSRFTRQRSHFSHPPRQGLATRTFEVHYNLTKALLLTGHLNTHGVSWATSRNRCCYRQWFFAPSFSCNSYAITLCGQFAFHNVQSIHFHMGTYIQSCMSHLAPSISPFVSINSIV